MITDDLLISKVKAALLCMQRRSWEQGVAAQACFETGDQAHGILMAVEAVHLQLADGRLAFENPAVSLDSGAVGEPLLLAAGVTGDPALQAAADRLADWFLIHAPRTEEGILYHFTDRPHVLVDGIYHVAPFLACAGHGAEAVRQIRGFRALLRDQHTGLYSHLWDHGSRQFVRRAFWGGGNGWMAAALARVLRHLPDSMGREKEFTAGCLRELVDACLPWQRDDGLFHDVLNDTSTFVETTAGLMIAYAMYRGIAGGWLPDTYRSPADRMREAAHTRVDHLGIVQGACGAPHFVVAGSSAEAQAFFLLCEAARADLGR